MSRLSHRAAAAELARRSPELGELIARAGPPRLGERHPTHFGALVRSITYQQLAGVAAAAIHRRLVALLDGDVTPAGVLALPPGALRSAGLSTAKAAAITDLAARTADGTVVLDPRRISREPDDEIIERLSTVRGIGRWTAEMFLLFQLRRLDVWPTGDLGVRRGFAVLHGIQTPTPRELEVLGDPFRPYRSVLAWYCWRAAEGARPAGPTPRSAARAT